MMEDDKLRALLEDLESDRVERKASASDMRKIRKAVCAFANDLPGHQEPGVVFVGVTDDGACAGLSIDDKLLKKLSEVRSNADILPVPSIQVDKRTLDGCEIAVIQVEPASAPPVRYAGRVWVRVGPTTREAGADDERILSERARYNNQPFDRRPVDGAQIDDIDLRLFEEEYLPSALAPEVLQRNNRSTDERLASLRFLLDGVPTNGALIVLGREPRDFMPGAYLQFVRIDGTRLGDPIKDEKELSGPLSQIVQQLDDLLEINVTSAVDFTSGPRERVTPDYPVEALRQLGRNALIHRNYESSNAPARLYWFNDRIEIHNPGGLYGQVTQSTFGRGVTDYRNPLIAEAMAHLGYVQRFGFGVPMARKLLKLNGNPPPDFDMDSNSFLVTVRPKP